MLKLIQNHLILMAEELLAEEQVGFRVRRSTVEQIFNCCILIEKHWHHGKDLLHNFQ